ncbi:MAG: amino acid permease [Streptosporangiales bacterium]|nr:amino acid permease [Streptosporangiales bacterium]
MPQPAGLLEEQSSQPEGFWYTAKRRLLGPPLVNEDLGEQRLSNPLALGVLSPDGVSSSAYGPEEILIALLPVAGMAAFTLIMPLTLGIIIVMTFVVLSYREVVMVYIRPGGSYVVARENFGPKVAQICAVALLIDYIVTVAVQLSAGTAAVASAIPALGPYKTEITVVVVLVMCYGNLRGLKEAGKAFAVPTYLFSGAVMLMIVVGIVRAVFGNLGSYDPHTMTGTFGLGAGTEGIVSVAMIFTLLKAFANGGASLTGIEAVSDAVGAFHAPEGKNARKVLYAEAIILGLLLAGIAWLAFATHATPRISGYPTVLAQEAQIVFGHSVFGQIFFYALQAASMLILYTGGNTSFNGFPFLASYVAGDSFLPRWLLKRGHRLVFSNAIITLTVLSVSLIVIKNANVNSLVPMYAIGVFTAFTMAGFGMAKYHTTHKAKGWQRKFVTNLSAGALSLIVVAVFAIVKFAEGAWVVVVLFAIFVPALIRLNSAYREEAEVLETISGAEPPPPPQYSRRVVFVLVDSFDLATLAALRYARSQRPTSVRAVHFVIDSVRADQLREKWTQANRGVSLDFVDCPDRRLTRAATELVEREIADPGTHVTVILPRRSYSPLLGRLLHDRTADKMASAISRMPRSAATIVPYDVPSRVAALQERTAAKAAEKAAARSPERGGAERDLAKTREGHVTIQRPAAAPAPEFAEKPVAREQKPAPVKGKTGVSPISGVTSPGKVSVEGKIRVVEIRPVERNSVLAVEIADETGALTALFYGRSHIPGLVCGARARFAGSAGIKNGQAVMINPAYELVAAVDEE